MDSRLYFVLGDLVSNILVGLVVGWLCALIVGDGWNMLIVMILAMSFGMVMGVLMWLPLGILFGAMEVMVPVMLTGMVSGMVVGMWATMEPMSGGDGAVIGAVAGVNTLVVVWVINNSVRGVRSYGEGGVPLRGDIV